MFFLINYFSNNVHSTHFTYIIVLFTDLYVRKKLISTLSSY